MSNEPTHQLVARDATGLREALDIAWVIIANAGGGDWTKETDEWQQAAARWRDENYHPTLAAAPPEPRWPSRDELARALTKTPGFTYLDLESCETIATDLLAALREGGERP